MSSNSNVTPENARGILVLEDGQEFEGFLFGAPVSARSILESSRKTAVKTRDRGYGEVVFNTSMTGYQEILTDPSYYGQIICMTVPHLGNTGVNEEDPESPHPWCGGFVVHEHASSPSNWRSEGGLDEYLKAHGVPGLHGVDTRALTRHLRSLGVVRGVILPLAERAQAKQLLAELPPFEGRDLIGEVTTREPYFWTEQGPSASRPKAATPGSPGSAVTQAVPAGFDNGSARRADRAYKVVALDYGVKWNLLRSLAHFGCEIEVVPARTGAAEILARKPDGVFLSNGPGDPSAAPYAAETVRGLVGQVPVFGVCMGHQILALALGAKTYKLKFGHRGGNQPVLDKGAGRVEISSHNHGYAVDGNSLPSTVDITHVNLNDKTVEGLALNANAASGKKKAFSVQYHPEACPGPHDSIALFEQFVQAMSSAPAPAKSAAAT